VTEQTHEQADEPRMDAPSRGTTPELRRRRVLIVLFVLYLVLLSWGVLYKFDTWIGVGDVRRVIKLVPFVAGNSLFASQPLEVLANLLLFVPFGVFLGLLAPGWRWRRQIAILAGTSILFETAQYVLAIGNSDITDVIVNTAGGLLGLVVLALARRWLGARADRVMTGVLVVVMLVAVLAVAALVASPLRFGPPHGDHLPRLGGASSTP
jgi:glycopeptide antibiotics resistance protein